MFFFCSQAKLAAAQEAERKLNELQDSTSSQEVAELRQELQEQEGVRASLEEKIKHITKLILVSGSVPSKERSNTASDVMELLKRRSRSATLPQNILAMVRIGDWGSGGDFFFFLRCRFTIVSERRSLIVC
jgi:hypothetical protein